MVNAEVRKININLGGKCARARHVLCTQHAFRCEMAIRYLLFEGSRRLKMAGVENGRTRLNKTNVQ